MTLRKFYPYFDNCLNNKTKEPPQNYHAAVKNYFEIPIFVEGASPFKIEASVNLAAAI